MKWAIWQETVQMLQITQETVVVEGEITIEAATVAEGVALSENLQLPPIVYHLVQEKCLEKLTRVQNDEAQNYILLRCDL